MSQEPLNPQLAGVEAALAGLQPARSALDRDRLMYLAGQAAGHRRARRAAWIGAGTSLAATLAACVLGAALVQRLGSERDLQTANVPATQLAQPGVSSWAANPPESRDGDASYLELRQLVLTRGVEAMPEIAPSTATKDQPPAPSQRRMLGHLLEG